MARKGMAGWYCDIPIELKQEFELRFKGRAKKRNVTIAAIKLAIREFDKMKSDQPPQESRPIEN